LIMGAMAAMDVFVVAKIIMCRSRLLFASHVICGFHHRYGR